MVRKRLYNVIVIFTLSFLLYGCNSNTTSQNEPSEDKSQMESIKKIEVKEPNDNEKKKMPNFSVYFNDRFGFSLKYPNNFKLERPPDNNAGQVFTAEQGMVELRSWAGHNADEETVDGSYNWQLDEIEASGGEIKYKEKKDDWFIISWVDEGVIHYYKRVIYPEVQSGFSFFYPEDRAEYYNQIVEVVEKSFKAADFNDDIYEAAEDQPDDFKIHGIRLYDEIDEVKKKFGEPSKTKSDELIYDGIEILVQMEEGTVSYNQVYMIRVTSNKFKTARGIKVGDTVSKLKSKYKELESQEDILYIQEYESIDAPLLGFAIKDNKVELIFLCDSAYLNY